MNEQLVSLSESSGVKFGTSGVRGLVADMSDRLCFAYTTAFVTAIASSATSIVIGHDLRPSSPTITAACIAAIKQAGKTPIYAGVLPTPALAYFALRINAPAVVITGSHIPFDRNGIKFYRADGEISKADEAAMLSATIDIPENVTVEPLPPIDPRAYQAYVERYTDFFGTNALSGARVLLYQHSSAARDILQDLLTRLGCDVLVEGRTDNFVPIDTEAVRPEDVEQARVWATQKQFDAIFSTDGDADRPLLGDENGQWFRGDIVGVLCAHYLQADCVVAPVSCNSVLESSGFFKSTLRTRIGSPYVIEGMAQADTLAVVMGFEANGGFLLGSTVHRQQQQLQPLPTRDAVLPMLALLCMAREQGCTLSALMQQLPPRFTYSNRLQNIATTASQHLLADLEQDATLLRNIVPLQDAITRIDKTDGLRLYFGNGEIVHFRPSGNAPELRCYCESDTAARAEWLCETSLKHISQQV